MKHKSYIVIHGNCPDGCAAAILAKTIDPTVKIVFGSHTKIDEQMIKTAGFVPPEHTMYAVDICGSEKNLGAVTAILAEKKSKIEIYDHHASRSWLSGYTFPSSVDARAVFSNTECGSLLFLNHLVTQHSGLEKFRDFVLTVNDRDLWLNKDSRSAELNTLHYILGDSLFIKRFYRNPSMTFSESEKALIDYELRREKDAVEKCFTDMIQKTDSNGNRYGVVYTHGKSSVILNAAINKFNLDYAIHIDLNEKKGAVRGKGVFDCSAYAEKFGGGGHHDASGFTFNFNYPEF